MTETGKLGWVKVLAVVAHLLQFALLVLFYFSMNTPDRDGEVVAPVPQSTSQAGLRLRLAALERYIDKQRETTTGPVGDRSLVETPTSRAEITDEQLRALVDARVAEEIERRESMRVSADMRGWAQRYVERFELPQPAVSEITAILVENRRRSDEFRVQFTYGGEWPKEPVARAKTLAAAQHLWDWRSSEIDRRGSDDERRILKALLYEGRIPDQ